MVILRNDLVYDLVSSRKLRLNTFSSAVTRKKINSETDHKKRNWEFLDMKILITHWSNEFNCYKIYQIDARNDE